MSRIRKYFKLGEVLSYFFRVFRKHDPKDIRYPSNFNIRMMHGINRISILMFLVCLIVIFVRRCVM